MYLWVIEHIKRVIWVVQEVDIAAHRRQRTRFKVVFASVGDPGACVHLAPLRLVRSIAPPRRQPRSQLATWPPPNAQRLVDAICASNGE